MHSPPSLHSFGVVVYTLLAWSVFVAAQTPDFEGKRIVAIDFQPASPLAPKDLERAQHLKIGDPLRIADVGATINALYATGRFQDIQVHAEPSGADGVVVRFVTKLTYFVGHIDITGQVSNPPNRGELANATQLNLGAPYRDADLKQALQSMTRLLQGNGLYEAIVQPSVTRDDRTQSVSFTFRLKIGKRAKYTTPIIEGTPKLSDATIIRATGWRVRVINWWRHVTLAKTRSGVQGIEKKYQSQDRLMAKVNLESLEYEKQQRRVRPTLNLDAGPKVEIKAVEAKVSKSTLKRYVPVYDEGAVDEDLLVEGARNLREYFQSQGYYDVSVDIRKPAPAKDEVTIEYVIAKGPRYKLVKVDIAGNKYFRRETLRERMFLKTASFLDRHGRYSEAFRTKDADAIQNLYKSNGFQDVKVTSEVLNTYKGVEGDIAVVFHVNEGPQWFVNNLTINGISRLTKAATESMRAALSSVKGQPYSLVNVAQDRNTILSTYYSHGFPAATFNYKVESAPQPNRVNLTYDIAENRQQFVRDVVITGLHITKPRLVNQRIKLHAGDELSMPEVTNIQKDLYNLGVFAKVNATVQNPNGDTDYKYVLYDFSEANRYTISVGFGAEIAQFGTTTTNLSDPGGQTGFSPRATFNISRLNFLGRGDTVSLLTRVSNLEQRAQLEYLQPRFMGVDARNITYQLLYDNARDVRTFSSRREEASVLVSQRISKSTTVQLGFAYRRVSLSEVVIPTLLVPQLLQPVRIGIISANFIQDRRDNPTDAHRGIFNTFTAGEASSVLGYQRNFLRLLGRNATYTPIGRNLVFARQTQLGVIIPYNPPPGISATASVPLPERFYGGGADSDRGFAYNQAGPRDIGMPAAEGAPATQPTGFPLGGNALFFNTFELRFPLFGANVSGAIFHDAGNVYQSFHTINFTSAQHSLQDFDYMVHAVGFGVRYRTPVGPIRVDLAYSINPPSFLGFNGTVDQLLACNPNLPPSQLPPVCTPVKQNLGHFQFFFSIGQAF